MDENRNMSIETTSRNNNRMNNINMKTSWDRSISKFDNTTRDGRVQTDVLMGTIFHMLDEVKINVIGLIQIIMNDVATRTRDEPQSTPINRMESSADTSKGVADRSMFNILRLSNLESAVNNKSTEGIDHNISNRTNFTIEL